MCVGVCVLEGCMCPGCVCVCPGGVSGLCMCPGGGVCVHGVSVGVYTLRPRGRHIPSDPEADTPQKQTPP